MWWGGGASSSGMELAANLFGPWAADLHVDVEIRI